uniref:Uncharacterized protein n=1 Tax=Ditylenchus dipsaci TaxID=166011 RepID=A0A915CZ20_9BILA
MSEKENASNKQGILPNPGSANVSIKDSNEKQVEPANHTAAAECEIKRIDGSKRDDFANDPSPDEKSANQSQYEPKDADDESHQNQSSVSLEAQSKSSSPEAKTQMERTQAVGRNWIFVESGTDPEQSRLIERKKFVWLSEGITVAEIMDKVEDSNILKLPILMLNENVSKMHDKVTEVTEGIASLSYRLDVFLGRDKDSISTKFEQVCGQLMEKELERKFEHSHDFICTFENNCGNEELDLCSFDTSKDPAYIMIECTLALMSSDKLQKCVRKRKAVANQFKVTVKSIQAISCA